MDLISLIRSSVGGHLGKRARNSVKSVGENWTEAKGLLKEQARLDKLAKEEDKAKKSLAKRQRSERQLAVREAGGSLKLSQAAKANPDQKSVRGYLASQKRKAPETLPPSTEGPPPKRGKASVPVSTEGPPPKHFS